jgi:hypothetical protein
MNRTDVVYFSRSAAIGSQQVTPLMWLGDQLTTWDRYDGLQTAVIGMLHAGVSGFTLSHSDIGGYTGIDKNLGLFELKYNRTKELLMRWCELAAFTAAYRSHAGNLPENNAQFWTDKDTLSQFARFAQVYVSWREYRSTLMDDVTQRGWPLVRALYLHYGALDPLTWDIDLQYMVGPDMMIAPVVDPGVNSVRVYFPVASGNWTAVFGTRHVSIAFPHNPFVGTSISPIVFNRPLPPRLHGTRLVLGAGAHRIPRRLCADWLGYGHSLLCQPAPTWRPALLVIGYCVSTLIVCHVIIYIYIYVSFNHVHVNPQSECRAGQPTRAGGQSWRRSSEL